MGLSPKNRGMKNRIQNFWYYYKIPAIIILIVIAVGIYLLSLRETVRSDYDIAIVSPRGCSEEQIKQIQSVLEQHGKDLDGDGIIKIETHVYRFSIGKDGQESESIAGLDADLVGKMSGIFFVDDPEQFEKSTNGIGKAADAIPVSEIPLLSGCGINDLYLLVRTGVDQKYIELRSALIN